MKRSNFFDIIKGIGILSVVIGHCCHNSLRKFVYTYHLVIFFFIAGYFYNKKKYEDDPFLHLATRIKSNWSRYCFYSFIFVLLHNVFFNMNILGDSPSKYFLHDFVTNCCNSLIFMCGELFSGALWFVPVLIFTMSIFGGLVYISNKTKKLNRDYSMVTLIFLCLITGLFGIVINLKSIYLAYHFQTSFLVIPIVLLGYLCKEYLKEEKIKKYSNVYSLIISFVLMIFLLKIFPNNEVELSANKIFLPQLFYFISIIGIYFCISLAKILEKTKNLSWFFSLMGKYSFDIMALHLMFFKLIDYINIKILKISTLPVHTFTVSNQKLWPIYSFYGITLSIIIGISLDILKKKYN